MWGELALSFQNGNIYMLSMLVLAFLGTVIIFERFLMLQFVYNIDFGKFLTNLRKMVSSEDYERAMNLCKTSSRTSLPKIALRALEASENDPTTVRGAIEEDTIEFLPRLESRLAIMPALATLIMLLGVLGTIDGLWWAFHSIEVLDTAKKQASLATGVTASLNPTAMGLIAAMAILACHQLLKGMAVRLVERIHYGVTVLHNLLVPAELAASYAAPAIAAPPSRETSDAIVDHAGGDPAGDEGRAADEAFDDAVVDDIKDEEEII